jgi:hypothetical protein
MPPMAICSRVMRARRGATATAPVNAAAVRIAASAVATDDAVHAPRAGQRGGREERDLAARG